MIVCNNVFCVSCMNLHFSLYPWLAYSVVQVFDGFVDGIAIFATFLHFACDDFEFNINNSKSQRSQYSNYVSIVLSASMLEDMSCRVLFLSCSPSASCGMFCSSFCIVPFCSASSPSLFEFSVLFLASCFSLLTVMSC